MGGRADLQSLAVRPFELLRRQVIDQGTSEDVSATAIFANSTLRITATVD
jgi:hypothetical protein